MDARDLAALNGQLAIHSKAARIRGARGSDEDVTNAILLAVGAAEIDIRGVLRRLRRGMAAARRAKPATLVLKALGIDEDEWTKRFCRPVQTGWRMTCSAVRKFAAAAA